MENRAVREVLLVGCKSSSPYSTTVVNPFNGNGIWSYKGNELRGAAPSVVEPVGIHADFIAVAASGQPFLHFVTPTKKTTVTTTLAGKLDSVRITKTGRFAFVLVNSKAYCYDLHSGELLRIAANSCLKSTKMYLCPNDKYLAFPMVDGNLFVYRLDRLLIRSSIVEEEVPPYCSFLSHSKEITDVSFSNFDSLFMLSVGLDHRLVLYCLNTRIELLKISFDVELTSCALSLSDTTIFCGTKTGRLVILSLFQAQQLDESTHIIQTQSDVEAQTHTILDKHDGKAICKIATNLDGARLATGDVEGNVMIWDVVGGQILARIRKDGEIHTLRFTSYWNSLLDPDHEADCTVIHKFQHEISDVLNPVVKTRNILKWDSKKTSQFQKFGVELNKPKANGSVSNKKQKMNYQTIQSIDNSEEDKNEHFRLNAEITKLRIDIEKLRTENNCLCELLLSEEKTHNMTENYTPNYTKLEEWTNTGTQDVMVFYPTISEMSDFSAYVQQCEENGAVKASGICKIVPPKEWSPRPNLDPEYKDALKYVIQSPIIEEIVKIKEHTGTFFKQNIVYRREMSAEKFRILALSAKYNNPRPDLSIAELEQYYWKNISFGRPIYGADTPGSLYESNVNQFNVAKLGTILDILKDDGYHIQGVNSPYLYFGMWKTTFAWHVEDCDLGRISSL